MSWANNAAHVTGKGNLNLGIETDDLSGDATQGYAKADCWFNVPLAWLVSCCLTQAGTFARTSAGLYTLAIASGTSTGVIVVPITALLRKFTGAPVASAPHGFKLTDLVLTYIASIAAETSINVTFSTNSDVNATARASVTQPFGTTITYENPLGTVVTNLPVTTTTVPYVCRAVPVAPIFVNTDNTEINAEIALVNPGTAIVTFDHIGFHGSVAIY